MAGDVNASTRAAITASRALSVNRNLIEASWMGLPVSRGALGEPL
jgi:hypothetical protein